MRSLRSALLGFILAACSGPGMRPETRSDAPVEVALPSASAQGVTAATATTTATGSVVAQPTPSSTGAPMPPMPGVGTASPDPTPALGEACVATDGPRPTCGARGRVSATWQMTGLGPATALPCSLRRFQPPPRGGDSISAQLSGLGEALLCVADDELVVYVPCFMCRIPTGDLVRARLSELTEAQHRAIAATLGADPPPLSPAAWRALAKSARPVP